MSDLFTGSDSLVSNQGGRYNAVVTNSGRPSVIDLFAGCGGLSLGLRRSGWDILCAVELSPMAAETYFANLVAASEDVEGEYAAHMTKATANQIRAGILVGDVQVLEEHIPVIRDMLAGRELGMLAGGPPCQGFSVAGRRIVGDPRNALVWTFLEMAELLRPQIVLMENVSAIQSPFEHGTRASVLADLEEALRRTAATFGGYSTVRLSLRADHYRVPQRRKCVFLVGVRRDIASAIGISDHEWWDSEQVDQDLPRSPVAPLPSATAPPTSSEALWDIIGSHYAPIELAPNATARQYALEARGIENCQGVLTKGFGDLRPQNHGFRSHRATTQARFRLLRLFQEHGIRSDLFKFAATGRKSLQAHLKPLEPLLPMAVSSQSVETLDQLEDLVRTLPSLKHRQRALDSDSPSPTVTTLPDDLCHYGADRTLTVREMARLQSFPDSFVFKGKETTGGMRRRVEVPQYSQVGNAVPPLLAEALGLQLRKIVMRWCATSSCCPTESGMRSVDTHGIEGPSAYR